MAKECPSGWHWDEKIDDCVQDIKETVAYRTSDSHFGRNLLTCIIGFLFGWLSLWSWGFTIYGFSILLILFIVMLGYLFFSGNKEIWYPVIGFVAGIILQYWSTISGLINFLVKLSGH